MYPASNDHGFVSAVAGCEDSSGSPPDRAVTYEAWAEVHHTSYALNVRPSSGVASSPSIHGAWCVVALFSDPTLSVDEWGITWAVLLFMHSSGFEWADMTFSHAFPIHTMLPELVLSATRMDARYVCFVPPRLSSDTAPERSRYILSGGGRVSPPISTVVCLWLQRTLLAL